MQRSGKSGRAKTARNETSPGIPSPHLVFMQGTQKLDLQGETIIECERGKRQTKGYS